MNSWMNEHISSASAVSPPWRPHAPEPKKNGEYAVKIVRSFASLELDNEFSYSYCLGPVKEAPFSVIWDYQNLSRYGAWRESPTLADYGRSYHETVLSRIRAQAYELPQEGVRRRFWVPSRPLKDFDSQSKKGQSKFQSLLQRQRCIEFVYKRRADQVSYHRVKLVRLLSDDVVQTLTLEGIRNFNISKISQWGPCREIFDHECMDIQLIGYLNAQGEPLADASPSWGNWMHHHSVI